MVNRLSRRAMLRAGALSGLGFAAACVSRAPQETTTQIPPSITNTPEQPMQPTPTASPQLKITSAPADEVWSWEKKLTGRVPDPSCGAVQVLGGEEPVEVPAESGTFTANVPLLEGQNTLTARCQPGGSESETVDYTVRLRNVPLSLIDISITGNGTIRLDGSRSQQAPRQPAAIERFTWLARLDNPAPVSTVSGDAIDEGVEAQKLVLAPPETDGEYYISLEVADTAGRIDRSTTYFTMTGGKPVLADWATENTAWVENAIVYGVIPRKFGSEGFQGLIDRLDSLQELGINALWLAPIHPSPPGDYGYAVLDYFNVRDRLGGNEAFKQLVDEAHRRGIRVLMDFVPNHSSVEHKYFTNQLEYGPSSHYWDFYEHDETGAATHYFNWEHLPNLNYNNPEVQQWMTEAFSYWVREFDVDGFRVDVAWGIRERNPEYWPQWRAALKRIKPDLLLLAEASARDAYYFTDGFDAAYDWTNQLGHWAWESVFEDNDLLIYNLNTALNNGRSGFHHDSLIFRFLNNNDTGGRFITMKGVGLAQVATTLLLTIPGIPCIYTGDEIGASFTPYGDPLPLNWDQDPQNQFAFHKTIVTLRRSTPALYSRLWQVIDVEPHQQVYAYLRYTESSIEGAESSPPALVLLNFFDVEATAEVEIPEAVTSAFAGVLRDALSEETFPAGTTTFPLAPYGARILMPQP